MKKHAIIPIFIPHIGCSESCVFCDQKQITARSKAPTADEVQATIDMWLTTLRENTPDAESVAGSQEQDEINTVAGSQEQKDEGNAADSTKIEIAFYGGSFTAIPVAMQKKYLSVAKEYIDRGLVDSLHLSTRPDCITPEILEMLASYGVRAIELGVQSFDDEVLTKSKRGHDAETVRRACRMIKEFRKDVRAEVHQADDFLTDDSQTDGFFDLGIQLMVGLPGDSMEACIYSAKEAVKLAPTLTRIYPTLVLEGTELMEMYRSGEYKPLTREEAIARSKAMYEILDDAGIYIMRVGLKSTDIINSDNLGDINEGAYHPAFRQLVEGRIARDRIEELISEQPDGFDETSRQPGVIDETARQPGAERRSITVYCSPGWVSNAAGHNGENRKYFKDKYPLLDLHFAVDTALKPGRFRI